MAARWCKPLSYWNVGVPPPRTRSEDIRRNLQPREEAAVNDQRRARQHFLYRLLDVRNRTIYIGITVSLKTRLKNHEKAPWWAEVAKTEFERFPDRRSAAEAESKAILEEQPRLNMVHRLRSQTPSKKNTLVVQLAIPPVVRQRIEDEAAELGMRRPAFIRHILLCWYEDRLYPEKVQP